MDRFTGRVCAVSLKSDLFFKSFDFIMLDEISEVATNETGRIVEQL